MEGSASQAGFYYQNNVAALQIIDCLFYQSDIREVILENYKKGNHIDDIIVFKNGHTDYFQVKWSEDEEKSYTLSSMLKSETNAETGKETKKSLFKQLAEGYVTAKQHSGTFSISLYTTKKVGRQKRPSEGLNHSLSEPHEKHAFCIYKLFSNDRGALLPYFSVSCIKFMLEVTLG